MNTNRSAIKRLSLICLVILASAGTRLSATTISPSQVPLFLAVVGNKPNIMLMLDNSKSMQDNLVPSSTDPSDMVSYTFTCNGNQVIGNGVSSGTPSNSVQVKVTNTGSLQACWSNCSGRNSSGNWYTLKTSSSDTNSAHKCFDVTKIYTVVDTGGTSLGTYSGLNLDWFFATNTFDSSLGLTPSAGSRITVAKASTKALIDALNSNVRVGLSTYYCPGSVFGGPACGGEQGGQLLAEVGDLTTAKKTALKTAVDNMAIMGYTPLGETLSDIGRYFTTGTTATTLKLHPDAASPTNTAVANVFNNHSLHNGTGSTATWAAPVQSSCQKSYAVLITDGLPTEDLAISTSMIGYTTAAAANNLATATSNNNKNYLDDVANTLADIDLRPDLTKNTTGAKNNLSTFTIGFGNDPDLTTTGVALLDKTAELGLGQSVFAEGGAALATALESAIQEITSRQAASAAIAANSQRADGSTMVYQAKFDSSDWTGNLLGFDINDTTGAIITPEIWDAGKQIPAYGDTTYTRNILTYNPSATPKGQSFACANLSSSQQTYLGVGTDVNGTSSGTTPCTSATDMGVLRINYLKGDWSHEETNPNRTDADTKRTVTANQIFRNRTHLDTSKHSVTPDPWVLGDIVSSNPVYASNEDYGYSILSGTEGSSYASYRTGSGTAATRRAMLYVGANDGMLHGFDAGAYSSTTSTHDRGTGREIFAYIPNSVYDHLLALTQPNYSHLFFVDGSPRVADAYYGGNWHTVLVGTTGAGGKGVFALDVTSPDSMTGSKVLWDISDTYTPNTSPVNELSNDTATLRGFGNNLGYTYGQASIVRMQTGDWAVILANGYGSVNNKAILYILSVSDGHIIKAIDTGAGPATSTDPPNGLSAPISVDVNGDRIVDYIYAGDLYGNMWKFDVSANSASSWGVAFSGSPLYVACVNNASSCSAANRQPITSKPQVGVGPLTDSSMVYFGTGKYLETTDNDVSSAQTQTFYGILDNGASVANRDSLQQQTIDQELSASGTIKYDLRFTSNNAVNYTGTSPKKGWYMDLLKPSVTTSDGERVIASPILRGDRVIFTTIIPVPPTVNSNQCGMNGSGWLMELIALTGAPIPATATPPWDINKDGTIDSNDLVNGKAPSGLRPDDVGMPTAPSIVKLPNGTERKYITGSQATISTPLESSPPESSTPASRQSWRQLR